MLFPVDQIVRIEAIGKQVRIHAGGRTFLQRGPLYALLERLEPGDFVRLSRSQAVAVAHIREIRRHFHGQYAVITSDGMQLVTTQVGRVEIEDLLGPRWCWPGPSAADVETAAASAANRAPRPTLVTSHADAFARRGPRSPVDAPAIADRASAR